MHTHIHFSIPFIQQRAGSQTTAIYLCCMNDMLRAYTKQRAIVILPEYLQPVHRPVMLIGTTSAWTVWACCRIFSSGVGKGSDLVQLV